MSIQTLKRYKVFDAGYMLLVSDGRFAKIVDADGNEVLHTPNPAVHEGVPIEVRWDEATHTFIPVDINISPLDDRYGVGTNYELSHGPRVFGGGLPDTFNPTDGSGNFVTTTPLSVDLVYSEASIHPVLIIEIFEARLASRQYVLYIGEKITDANAATYVGISKDQLINALAADYVVKAQAAYNAASLGSVTITYNATTREFDLSGLINYDGFEPEGESYVEASQRSPHITQSAVELLLTIPLQGTNFFGIKPVRGAYIMFNHEKLTLFPEIVKTTVNSLTTLTQDEKDELLAKLGYSLNDWFRGMSQTITVNGKTVVANVFLSVISSGTVLSTITIEDPAHPGTYIDVKAIPVNLEDAFSYEDDQFHRAYPDALQYVTGPFGPLPIRDPQTGNIIGYMSDQYTV